MTENHEHLPELLPELLDDLRALAADGPREAPSSVEVRLRTEFRRHNRRRKLATWTSFAGVAAAAVLALVLWVTERPKHVAVPVAQVERAAAAVAAEDDSDASFYPLPEAEALPAVENAMVVRVQLPVSSLRLMGVPVSEERADASVQAELLLGQDGLARGVRIAE
jgi:hypothetical protein